MAFDSDEAEEHHCGDEFAETTYMEDRPARNESTSSLPVYVARSEEGLAAEFVQIDPLPDEKDAHLEAQDNAQRQPSITYLPPPFPVPEQDTTTPGLSFSRRHGKFISFCRYIIVLSIITALLAIPVFLNRANETENDWEFDEDRGMARSLSFYVFVWIFITWTTGCASNIVANVFPYVFRVFARWIHPGHEKYWRVFRFLRGAITLLGGSLGSYVAYTTFILDNKSILALAEAPKTADTDISDALVVDILSLIQKYLMKATKRHGSYEWNKILHHILSCILMWATLYMLQKIAMLYVTIHYHYRAGGNRIDRSKHMRNMLCKLYDASISLHPQFKDPFRSEDLMIRGLNQRASSSVLLAKAGRAGRNVVRGLDKTINSNQDGRWFKSTSTYAIVDHSLSRPRSSVALARRIWMSLVPEGHNVLTLEDIVEVFGPARRQEAEEVFDTIDENENGNLTITEMALAVLEAGRARNAVYQGMTDIKNAIGSLEAISVIFITCIVAGWAILRFAPALKGIKEVVGFAALGLSFGMGRTLHEFLNGCIFIFFKHAYDVGDRVEVYNPQATVRTSVIVTRVSILYTVFRRLDNGKDLQMSNDRLNMKRIENVTRSGLNHEEVSIFVDFNTTFSDIQCLKDELQGFLKSKENQRDYRPDVEIRVVSIFEMNKLELKCSFTHKSNWSNEELRAARSSKFMCALVASIRRISLPKPGALGANPVLRPGFTEEHEADAYRSLTHIPIIAEGNETAADAMMTDEIRSIIGPDANGLRKRSAQFPIPGYFR